MAGMGTLLTLGAADVLATYIMFMLITYLTDVLNLSFLQAAALINLFWGLVSVLPLFLMFISESLSSRFVVVTTHVAYSIGLVLLTVSTPPVLGNTLGTCTEFEPSCIGQSQRILFYTGVALIALGMAGRKYSLESFDPVQVYYLAASGAAYDPDNRVMNYIYSNYPRLVMFLVKVGVNTDIICKAIAVLILPYFKSWTVRFGVPAAFTLLVTLFFLQGLSAYMFPKAEGSSLIRFFRVFISATSKLFCALPADDADLYEAQDDQVDYKLPHTDILRIFDKAAIILPTKPLEQQQNNKWRLCTVTEVEDTKKMVHMIPVCMTLIFCGVVSAIGWAFFAEQLGHLNPKIWSLTVSTGIILWFHENTKDQIAQFARRFGLMLTSAGGGTMLYFVMTISISMIVAILCCITAALVEHRRLGVAQKHGIVDGIVPMTMLWLMPQFILLGLFTGWSKYTAEYFFKPRFPKAAISYLPLFVEALYGIGAFCGVALIYIVGSVSEIGGNKNWFQESLNASRVDNYFWTLTCLMAINCVAFIAAGIWYSIVQTDVVEFVPESDESLQQQLIF